MNELKGKSSSGKLAGCQLTGPWECFRLIGCVTQSQVRHDQRTKKIEMANFPTVAVVCEMNRFLRCDADENISLHTKTFILSGLFFF